jgi:hypothetical protein
MDEEAQRREDRRLALAGLWALGVVLYLAWSALTETGLCYLVATWEIDQFGSYQPSITPFGPALVLIVVPFAFVRRRARSAAPVVVPDPARELRKLRKLTRFLGALGVTLLLVAGFCFWRAPSEAGEGAPAPRFDVRGLQNGPPPDGRVQLDGRADPAAFAVLTVDTSGKTNSSYRYEMFAVFHATGDTVLSGAPARLLVNRLVGRNGPGPELNDPDEPWRGYLVQDGLDPLARHVVEAKGISLAEPYYVLLRRPDQFWFDAGVTAAGIGLFILLFAGGLVFVEAKWRRRSA